MSQEISRRDFLKASLVSALAVSMPGRLLSKENAPRQTPNLGLYIDFGSFVNKDKLALFKEKLLKSGANTAIVDIKAGGMTHVEFEHPLKVNYSEWPEDPQALKDFIGWADSNKIRVVGRMVIMGDKRLLSIHPELALKDSRGGVWLNVHGNPWANPYRPEIAEYNAAIAKAAVEAGVDEVQYDYVRFPSGESDIEHIRHTHYNSEKDRVEAITNIVKAGKKAVGEAGGLLSVDFFGGTAWKESGDMGIGQSVEAVAPYVDSINPMAYLSLYGTLYRGLPASCQEGSACPYEIVYLTTKLTRERLLAINPEASVEPWIQVYRDSRFGNPITIKEFEEQQRGALEGRATGVHAWNTTLNYPDDLYHKYENFTVSDKLDYYEQLQRVK